MAYRRFLVDTDYLPVLTQEHMKQLVREIHDRIPMAEQTAEMNMLEYLDQYYEIEAELRRGKSIGEYSPLITYPAGVYLKYDEKVYKTLVRINGRKLPTNKTYWEKLTEYGTIDIDSIGKYSQLKSYVVGDLVTYSSEIWRCTNPNGLDFNTIQLPGVRAWEKVECEAWAEFVDYQKNDIASYDGNFYMLIEDEPSHGENGEAMPPSEDNNWGMIAEYSESYDYGFGYDSNDYVVHENEVYRAVIDPNAVKPELGVNIVADDPRNMNVITHMVRLSVYYLHQLISPTNISETRRAAYEDSMLWLQMASKFKINPQIPRKINKEDGRATTDWAIETYQREFNPNNNPWLI